ncbi:dihydroneopterin aldolase [Aetokthonos hydrillicola Thurmond2011]|jgi:dihydroneopterin aldolase|uniref:7,8-dihydroneopterin aldolase n=1 Tax=Aetokthonos hydrillicola Thurmond2011 TaxID=2712845 RepID=A0AAP5I3A2_9CYAN|nr:dihydroneopterin aldolase [Aetokthonos hydrillicola]MBO3459233.1 dihydroneopterin aldolase [Aetokthonos hydrillicola CCALA 1050]MBW4584934.1 dihydroneopterin aldolase [Aetokthonos hydrillicola CCALA 1050]MDR9894307.1 dihydroneopterin aldolase [Aetokthonos hydrillicola Thurmond2011]
MDCIHLTGIRSYGYTGYLPEEQVLGQWFEVDVKLWLDLSTSAKTDAIEDTVDYRNVINLTQHLIKTSKFVLVERLTATIADSILAASDRIAQVQVTLSKPAAPIPDFGGKITIELTRSKPLDKVYPSNAV